MRNVASKSTVTFVPTILFAVHHVPFLLSFFFILSFFNLYLLLSSQMLDVKEGGRGVFVCSSPGADPYTSQDLYNPVYEELSNGKCR